MRRSDAVEVGRAGGRPTSSPLYKVFSRSAGSGEQAIADSNEGQIVLDVFLKMEAARQPNGVTRTQWVALEQQLCARDDRRSDLDDKHDTCP